MKKTLLLFCAIALSGCADPGALKRVVSQVTNPPAPVKPVLPPVEVTNYFKFQQQEVRVITASANEAKAYNNKLKIVLRSDDIVFTSQGKPVKMLRNAELTFELPGDAVTVKSIQVNAFAASFGRYVLNRSATEPTSIKVVGRNQIEADYLKALVVAGSTEKISIESSIGAAPMLAFVSIGPTNRVIK